MQRYQAIVINKNHDYKVVISIHIVITTIL
jgi:hypothetical protein